MDATCVPIMALMIQPASNLDPFALAIPACCGRCCLMKLEERARGSFFKILGARCLSLRVGRLVLGPFVFHGSLLLMTPCRSELLTLSPVMLEATHLIRPSWD